MYIKDYLFGLLEHYTFTMQEIINDTAKKSEIVSLYLEEICDYLYNIRTTIDKSRLSTCNNRTILRIIKQQEISEQERKYLTELLAFGIEKENLENKNFKSLERLIYIPRNKPKKPKF